MTGAIVVEDVVATTDNSFEACSAAEGRGQDAVPGPLRRANGQTGGSGTAERRDLRRKQQQRETSLRLDQQRRRN